ncbi:MAG: hypothetical protein COT81_02520 [Candidatus Buchananbacteria bacterium CG10_big_fil_rev_8_21_14_0_10_42_9]|uniref:Uncharacterized protein n=1 Tax=Candidatus Buchananbacteria bacterium CG10_big_fil_rev_8_21_14_0_10_42_9 TaxID=1974526 RepID=A0A2H0W1E9_9BACT|nr:MAG: hypothetical protein COT81_02520 [Candidatus Buchananbacteria bacterium CG10_big_fil_rev_8_21_14_0_10_42_9]
MPKPSLSTTYGQAIKRISKGSGMPTQSFIKALGDEIPELKHSSYRPPSEHKIKAGLKKLEAKRAAGELSPTVERGLRKYGLHDISSTVRQSKNAARLTKADLADTSQDVKIEEQIAQESGGATRAADVSDPLAERHKTEFKSAARASAQAQNRKQPDFKTAQRQSYSSISDVPQKSQKKDELESPKPKIRIPGKNNLFVDEAELEDMDIG